MLGRYTICLLLMPIMVCAVLVAGCSNAPYPEGLGQGKEPSGELESWQVDPDELENPRPAQEPVNTAGSYLTDPNIGKPAVPPQVAGAKIGRAHV